MTAGVQESKNKQDHRKLWLYLLTQNKHTLASLGSNRKSDNSAF